MSVLPVITPYLVWSQWEPGSHRHTRSLLMRPQFSNARTLPMSFRQWWADHRVHDPCELPRWTSGPEWTAAADSQHWAADEKFNIFLVGTVVLENSLELPEFYSENFTAAICVCANSWCGKGSATPSVLGLLRDQDTVLCCPWKQPGLCWGPGDEQPPHPRPHPRFFRGRAARLWRPVSEFLLENIPTVPRLLPAQKSDWSHQPDISWRFLSIKHSLVLHKPNAMRSPDTGFPPHERLLT